MQGGLVWAKKKKRLSGRGSVLATKVRVGLFLGGGDPIRVGYTGIEVWGGCDWVTCERGVVWAKKQKLSHGGLVLTNEMWVGLFWGRGDPIGVGHAGVKVQAEHDRVRHKGGWFGPKKNKNGWHPTQCLQNIQIGGCIHVFTSSHSLALIHTF